MPTDSKVSASPNSWMINAAPTFCKINVPNNLMTNVVPNYCMSYNVPTDWMINAVPT